MLIKAAALARIERLSVEDADIQEALQVVGDVTAEEFYRRRSDLVISKGRGIADVEDITPDKTADAAESQRDSAGRSRSTGEAVDGEERRVTAKQMSGSGSDEDGIAIIAAYREILVETMGQGAGAVLHRAKGAPSREGRTAMRRIRPSTMLLSAAIAGFMVSAALAQASNYTLLSLLRARKSLPQC
jgi:hypothetical protein